MGDVDAWVQCMRKGDFAGAWRVSDTRRLRPSTTEWRKPRHVQQIWNGTDVRGARVLVRCYHGLGDTIQFVRFLPQLRALASDVTLWAQPALLPLLASCAGVDRLLPLHDGVPDVAYDVDVEVMELPYLLRTTLPTLPATVPYLRAPGSTSPADPADSRPLVSIAWRAGSWDAQRSMPVELAWDMVAGTSVRIRPLPPDLTDAESSCFPPVPGSNDLSDVAVAVQNSDLVITVDTVFAHLAGALGRPVWILLPAEADWRWMCGRDDSPWYPTARLYRQPDAGAWPAVAARVRDDLVRRLEAVYSLP